MYTIVKKIEFFNTLSIIYLLFFILIFIGIIFLVLNIHLIL